MTFELPPPEPAGPAAAPAAVTPARSTAPLFDDSRGAERRVAAVDALATVVGGEHVELMAERALHWPRERTLFVADVHLGKAATFRAHGVPLPRGVTATDLDRLSRLLERTGATRIVVLGDLIHARAGRVASLDDAVVAWRQAHRGVRVILVRGNHDKHAGDPPPAWDVECVADPHAFAPFLACHAPVSPPSGYALCGHVHPGVRLYGRGEETARLPCFVLGPRHAVLPAFGRFTGLALVAPAAGSRLVAIAGSTLFPLPPAGA
jgi:DNA ligase-associated metallophosphoesterase